MNTYQIRIQLNDHSPCVYQKIEISDQFTFHQFHEIMCILMGWKNTSSYRFFICQRTISKTVNTSHPLSYYLQEFSEFQYTVQEEGHEHLCNIQALLQLKPVSSLRLIHVPNDFINKHCKVEPVKMQRLLDFYRIQELQISDESFDIESDFTSQLLTFRSFLETQAITSPHLLMIEFEQHRYPCYMEPLDNGIELMFFFDESGFVRSIMNSINGDPDLLFTDAITIDFLYDEVESHDLFLSHGKNLCFRNIPGCLPQYPSTSDFLLLNALLECMVTSFVSSNQPLVSLLDQQLLFIDASKKVHIQDFIASEQLYHLHISAEEQADFLRFPHTNETITLSLVAMPNQHLAHCKELDIHLIATGFDYTKDKLINVQSMDVLLEQLYVFLHEVMYERCIPEAIHSRCINLIHILSSFAQALDIQLQIQETNLALGNDILDLITQTLQLSPEEMALLDDVEGNPSQLASTILVPITKSIQGKQQSKSFH